MGNERAYWLAFHLVYGISLRWIERLRTHFGDLATAWEADQAQLQQLGLRDSILERFRTLRQRLDPHQYLATVEAQGIRVLCYPDEAYPPRLREIPSPPLALFMRGELTPADDRAVALVGTRQATSYGQLVTQQLASELCQHGITIVSGLAYGIDRVAHEAALDAGGRSIAVFGTGVDVVYPRAHQRLAERLIEHGAILSEFPPGTRPIAENFPIRNRIISGLSLGVIVVEAPMRSGALITARFAAEQGRSVYAVPGPITSPVSQGTLALLKDGATPIGSARDVLDDLQLEVRQLALPTPPTPPPASPHEAQILALLTHGPYHIDDLAAELGLGISQMNVLLLEMQLQGQVRHLGAQLYARA